MSGRSDALSAGLLLAAAAVAWLAARDLPTGTLPRPGPGFFPHAIAALLAALTLALLLRALTRPGPALGSLWPDRAGAARAVALGAALLGYVALVETAGYLLTTALLFVLMLRGLGRQRWSVALPISGAAAAGSWLLFHRWLLVKLPAGVLLP